jgi:2-succinyl-6-hydroxy-2,4-cyclohexadiene-1-carboxylate synthase
MHAVSHLELPNGIRIEIEQWGHGDRPLVLVHGYTGSRDDWREQLDALSTHGLTIALDLRGHGGSTNTGDAASYDFPTLAGDLLLVFEALGIERCDLLGHSMGGIVALLATLRAPERVASLILMDTLARPQSLLPDAARAATRKLVEAAGMPALADAMEGAARAGAAPQPDAMRAHIERLGEGAYWRRIRAKLLAMDPVAFNTLGDAFNAWPGVVSRLGEIDCPTTVLVGEQDAPFRAPADELSAGIPGARLEVIAQAAHSPQLENPDAWRAAVFAHLDRARALG